MVPELQRVQLNLTGLSCSHCAASVEKAVMKVNGIKKVSVDLDASKMSVEFEGSKANINDIKKAVKDAGYGVAS
ncbi:MAG: heavy-metal-associated domain-containing protein [Dehalogenimonas sp.]